MSAGSFMQLDVICAQSGDRQTENLPVCDRLAEEQTARIGIQISMVPFTMLDSMAVSVRGACRRKNDSNPMHGVSNPPPVTIPRGWG